MRILILHVSDIHFRPSDNPVINRASAIASSVQDIDAQLDACVIVASGDIAWSGVESEYLEALSFFGCLKDELKKRLCAKNRGEIVPTYFLAAPGNHDCDFSVEHSVRNILLDQVLHDHQKLADGSISNICLHPFRNFFQFLSAAEDLPRSAISQYDGGIAYQYAITNPQSSIRFVVLNTAILSRKKDNQGRLAFPIPALSDANRAPSDLVVAVLHHPFGWHESVASRALRQHLESHCDLILTGHEHEATQRRVDAGFGQTLSYFEAGSLQDPKTTSSFNAIVLDLSTKQHKFVQLCWDGNYYAAGGATQFDDKSSVPWRDLPLNHSRNSARFYPSRSFEEHLSDTGVALSHPDRERVDLEDLYVFPTLREVNFINRSGVTKDVRGERVFDLVRQTPITLITGDAYSGKSSLSKALCRRFINAGMVPILIQANGQAPKAEKVQRLIESTFVEQYGAESLPHFRNLDRAYRVIIVDDFHKWRPSKKVGDSFEQIAAKYAGRLILLASDLAVGIDDALKQSDDVALQRYTILPMGHVARDELVRRWFSLSDETDTDPVTTARRIDNAARTINHVIGSNFVPSFPVYVLSILVATDSNTPVDTQAGTHGYFYELFIKTTLARRNSAQDYEIKTQYMSSLAWEMYTKRASEFSKADLRAHHGKFEQTYDIARDFEKLVADLVQAELLISQGDSFRFKYRYIYFYFAAHHIRDTISDAGSREAVRSLAESLHSSEPANILLFLAHLSKDPFIIETLIAAAKSHFSDVAPVAFNDDSDFLNELADVVEEVVLEDSDPTASRQKLLEAADSNGDPPNGEEVSEAESDDPLSLAAKINGALKALQIVGQILKNFPTMLAETKTEIASTCFDLGLRILGSFFQHLRSENRQLIEELVKIVERRTGLKGEAAVKRARQTVLGLARLVTLGIVVRTANAVGSPELSTTFGRVLEKDPSLSRKTIRVAIDLEHAGFPSAAVKELAKQSKDCHLAIWTLRDLVINHFHLFPVDFKTKQAICQALGIRYGSQYRLDQGEKRLGPGAKDGI